MTSSQSTNRVRNGSSQTLTAGCDVRDLVPRIPDVNRWDEKTGLRRDAVRSQVIDAPEAQEVKETGYPQVALLKQVKGVGTLIALSYSSSAEFR